MGHTSQLPSPGSFFTSTLNGHGVLVCKDAQGRLRAFWNVRLWPQHTPDTCLLVQQLLWCCLHRHRAKC